MSPPTATALFDKAEIAEQRGWIGETLRATIKTEITHESLIDWAERKRIIAKGLSPMDGAFSWDVTPYLEEIADNLSELSPIQETAVMKGAQVGFTVGVLENFIGYCIDVAPAPTLFVGADKESAEEVMKTRIGPMIQESGLADKIFAPASAAKTRATGDTNKLKEFAGGRLRAIGPGVGAKLRSSGYSRLMLDELDAWQNEVGTVGGKKKAEGSTLANIIRRSDAYEETRKILYGSTPLIKSSSIIEPLFEQGDQRRFFVPCKHCGAMQYLKWAQIKWEQDETGRLIEDSVRYECEACGGAWKNSDKVNFMRTKRQGGTAEWRPTAIPRRRGIRSYHLPSFYSPVGFRSWESIVQEWLDVGDDLTKRQTIVNTVFGETWYEKGLVPDYTKVMAQRVNIADGDWGSQPVGTWPDVALIWTAGIDTQDDRLECEIVAWGRNLESWSLGYHILTGDTSDLADPCWSRLAEILDDLHGETKVALALIDSGGHRTTEVYKFAENYVHDRGQLLPCSGDGLKTERRIFGLFKIDGYAVKRADLRVDNLKAELYGYLNRGMPESGGLIPRGFCHFPRAYEAKYYRGLMSEERVPVRLASGRTVMRWSKIKGQNRNEPLDCRVYAMGALYVFKQLYAEQQGVKPEDEMTWDDFWDLMELELR